MLTIKSVERTEPVYKKGEVWGFLSDKSSQTSTYLEAIKKDVVPLG